MEKEMKFYRYELLITIPMADDEYGGLSRHIFRYRQLSLITLNFHKETPKGYWIGYGYCEPDKLRSHSRWVSKNGKKRYAYPTKEEALVNYIKRTEKRKKYLQNDLFDCEEGIKLAQQKQKELQNGDNNNNN